MPLPYPAFAQVTPADWMPRDPWSVRSLGDLFRVYLPESSFTAAAAILSGVLAGKMATKLGGHPGPFLFPLAYVGVLSLWFSFVSIRGRRSTSIRSRSRIRNGLLAALVVFGIHLLGYFVLKAGTQTRRAAGAPDFGTAAARSSIVLQAGDHQTGEELGLARP